MSGAHTAVELDGSSLLPLITQPACAPGGLPVLGCSAAVLGWAGLGWAAVLGCRAYIISLVLLILPCLAAALQLRLPDLREGESLMPPARQPAWLPPSYSDWLACPPPLDALCLPAGLPQP